MKAGTICYLLILASFVGIGTAGSDTVTHVPHPRAENLVGFPDSMVADSRLAWILASEEFLLTLERPVATSVAMPSQALTDIGQFAKKGDKLWEVEFFATSREVRQRIALVVVNARTGKARVQCRNGTSRPCK